MTRSRLSCVSYILAVCLFSGCGPKEASRVESHPADVTMTPDAVEPIDQPDAEVSPPEAIRFVGHQAPVLCVALSLDGTRLLSGSGCVGVGDGQQDAPVDNSVRLWDTATGREILQMAGHERMVWAVAFSPDATKAASASLDGTCRLWDVETGKEIWRIDAMAFDVGWFGDGRRIFSADADSTVTIRDALDQVELLKLGPKIRTIRSAAVSRDGRLIVAGGTWSEVWAWDAETGAELATIPLRRSTLSVAITPSAQSFLVCTPHHPIELREIATAKVLGSFRGHSGYDTFCSDVSRDGDRFASCGSDGTVRVWSISQEKEVQQVTGLPVPQKAIAMSDDGKTVVAAGGECGSGKEDFAIRLWRFPVD